MSFRKVSISQEQYKNVRTMITENSKKLMHEATTRRLVEIRYKLQQLRAEVTADVRAGKETVLPTVYFQYVPEGEQKGKRWAYRKALAESIAFIDALLTERGNVVSRLLLDELQEPVQPAPAEAVTATEEDLLAEAGM